MGTTLMRVIFKQLNKTHIMKYILITLMTVGTVIGNTLPPTPEFEIQNSLPPTWELVPKENTSWELVSQDDFEITPHLEA
jgi:hypothetical protein